jgi:alkanesulfonate monooxygenase SsuD/methylene tetrahydromethanopterin reductase-like flavin-dependent oxidoreductase (luciferase family)
LPLRPAALVAEEIAWLAARHPGRVGLGLAAGALSLDFEAMDLELESAVPKFKTDLPRVTAMLRGEALGALAGDPALARCAAEPIPVLSAAVSPAAGRRAARVGAGILLESMSTPARQRAVCDAFMEAGGAGPRVAIRRVWIGAPPTGAIDAQRAVYESDSPSAAQAHWAQTNTLAAEDGATLAAALRASVDEVNADALNLRVHMPGIEPRAIREQIALLGAEVLPRLR